MVDLSPLGILTAFAGGVVSFLSPCVLPLVPGYLSYIAGQSMDGTRTRESGRRNVLGLGACFVLGFSTVFVALGASATLLGRLLLSFRYEANLIAGLLVIAFGLFLTGLLRLPTLQRDLRLQSRLRGGTPVGAYALGLAFAFGWTPCIGPVLGAILTVSTVSPAVSTGTMLLAVYSMGLGLPFLLAAAFLSTFLRRLRGFRRVGRWMQVFAGGVLVLMGLAMITGQLTRWALWLLDNFPVLGRVG